MGGFEDARAFICMNELLEEIHPGEILLTEFMTPLGMTDAILADKMNVPLELVHKIINGQSSITQEIACSLEEIFLVNSEFWMNLQSEYDSRTNRSLS